MKLFLKSVGFNFLFSIFDPTKRFAYQFILFTWALDCLNAKPLVHTTLTIKFMEPIILKRFNDLQPTVDSYEPPQIEILEITVEKGFAGSS